MLNPDKDIFHITAETNLPAILRHAGLFSKNCVDMMGVDAANIAYQSAQDRRALKQVSVPPHGNLHDYVPFYFAPRSPMLNAIHNGNVDSCLYRQNQIIHLVSSINRVVFAKLQFVFYDYNATTAYATAYNNLNYISEIDWELFYERPQLDGYCKYWHDNINNPKHVKRKATRGAEFLVYQHLPWHLIFRIGVADESALCRVVAMCETANVKIPIEVKTDWYYQGQ